MASLTLPGRNARPTRVVLWPKARVWSSTFSVQARRPHHNLKERQPALWCRLLALLCQVLLGGAYIALLAMYACGRHTCQTAPCVRHPRIRHAT